MKIQPIERQYLINSTILMVCIAVTVITVLGTLSLRPDLAFAQVTPDKTIVVHITRGNPKVFDEVHAAYMGISLATKLQDTGKNTTVYLDVNSVNLGLQRPPLTLNETASMLKDFIANGGTVWVCSHCLTEAGYGPEDLLAGAQLAPGRQTMAEVLSGDTTVIDY
jgi:hypothetical protein